MIDDVWWIFSQNQPPQRLIGNLHPAHTKGLEKAWAYRVDADQWYWFNEYSRNWNGGWDLVTYTEKVPNEYLIQLLLIN